MPGSGNFLGCVSGMKSPWGSAALDHRPCCLAHRWGFRTCGLRTRAQNRVDSRLQVCQKIKDDEEVVFHDDGTAYPDKTGSLIARKCFAITSGELGS